MPRGEAKREMNVICILSFQEIENRLSEFRERGFVLQKIGMLSSNKKVKQYLAIFKRHGIVI